MTPMTQKAAEDARTPRAGPVAPETGFLRKLEEGVDAVFHEMLQDPFYARFLSGGLGREEYAYFLVQTYHYVMITPDTYGWAMETMRRDPRPHYAPLLEQFEEHWHEETGHEHWLLEDLTALGYDAEALVRSVGPNPAVEAYIAWSRFFTRSRNPLALLGQDFFLESLAQRYGERIVRGLLSGPIPGIAKAVKFIAGHGEADIRHMEMNRESVLRITDPEEQRAIALTAEVTGRLYAAIPLYYAPPAKG